MWREGLCSSSCASPPCPDPPHPASTFRYVLEYFPFPPTPNPYWPPVTPDLKPKMVEGAKQTRGTTWTPGFPSGMRLTLI